MRGKYALSSVLLLACTEAPRMQPLPPAPDRTTEPAPAAADLSGVVNPMVDLAPVPLSLTDITPKTGSTAGGYQVTITGDGFDAFTRFSLDNLPLVDVVVKSGKEATGFVAKSLGSFGPVTLRAVSKTGQVVTRMNAFRFVPASVEFKPRTDIQVAGCGPFYLAARDLDGDKRLDIVTNVGNSNNMTIFLNKTTGFTPNFVRHAAYGLTSYSHCLAVEDMDKDGKLDIMGCDHGNCRAVFFKGNGDGTFQDGRRDGTGTSCTPTYLDVADLNGDGNPDFVSANYFSSCNVGIFHGNGNGGFSGQRYAYGTSCYPYTVSIGDLNGDNKPDFISGNLQSDNVGVFINNGNGEFPGGQVRAYGVGSQPHWVGLFDLNRDGKLDIVSPNYNGNSITTYFGNGDGTFGGRMDYPQQGGPIVAAAADVNGDDHNDLVITLHRSHYVTVLINKGDGTFGGERLDYLTGQNPRGVLVGNFNNDNKPDIIVANQACNDSGNTISVFVNDSK